MATEVFPQQGFYSHTAAASSTSSAASSAAAFDLVRQGAGGGSDPTHRSEGTRSHHRLSAVPDTTYLMESVLPANVQASIRESDFDTMLAGHTSIKVTLTPLMPSEKSRTHRRNPHAAHLAGGSPSQPDLVSSSSLPSPRTSCSSSASSLTSVDYASSRWQDIKTSPKSYLRMLFRPHAKSNTA